MSRRHDTCPGCQKLMNPGRHVCGHCAKLADKRDVKRGQDAHDCRNRAVAPPERIKALMALAERGLPLFDGPRRGVADE